jgi:hypothetical protein
MVDGVGGNDLMAAIFATDPGERPPMVIPWVPALRSSLAGQAAGELRYAVTGPFGRLAGAPGLLRRGTVGDLLEYGRGLAKSPVTWPNRPQTSSTARSARAAAGLGPRWT